MSEEGDIQYSIRVDGGEPETMSRGKTGTVEIQYPNGDTYSG